MPEKLFRRFSPLPRTHSRAEYVHDVCMYLELHFPRLSRNDQFVEIACLRTPDTKHWGLLGRGASKKGI